MKSICTNEYSRKISKVKHQCPSNSVMDIVDFSAPPFLEVVRLRECRFLSSVYRRVGLKGEWRPREGRRGGDECNLQLSGDRQWNCRRKREGEGERSSSALCLPHSELFGSALRSWESYDGEILNVGDITIYAEGTKFCSKNEVS